MTEPDAVAEVTAPEPEDAPAPAPVPTEAAPPEGGYVPMSEWIEDFDRR